LPYLLLPDSFDGLLHVKHPPVSVRSCPTRVDHAVFELLARLRGELCVHDLAYDTLDSIGPDEDITGGLRAVTELELDCPPWLLRLLLLVPDEALAKVALKV
jgi:hypothetical protein